MWQSCCIQTRGQLYSDAYFLLQRKMVFSDLPVYVLPKKAIHLVNALANSSTQNGANMSSGKLRDLRPSFAFDTIGSRKGKDVYKIDPVARV